MFDTPDLMPLCVAPFVAILIGVLVYAIGSTIGLIVGKKTGKRRIWLNPIVLVLTSVSIPVACITSVTLEVGATSPAPWFEPTTSNIVGEWKLSSTTIRALGEWYGVTVSTHELVFEEDGTFHVSNIPAFWGLLDSTITGSDRYISGSGTWYLGQVQGTQRLEWVIFAQFQDINGHSDDRLMRFYFEGHLPPYELVTLGSAGLAFRFHRE